MTGDVRAEETREQVTGQVDPVRRFARRSGRHLLGSGLVAGALQRIPGADSAARRVAVNSGWLVAERMLRMVISLAITIQIVRYLGPIDFGTLAYGFSLIAIVDTVVTMGMRSTVVREIVERPAREQAVLGTTIGLRLGGSLLILAVLLALWLSRPESRSLTVLAVLALGLPAMAFAQIDFYFQARLESRYSAVARTAALGLASVVRVGLLIAGAPLVAFAAAGAIEFAATGIAFALLYQRRAGSLLALRFGGTMARRLIAISWPLFASALAAAVYLKIDQVMLQHLSGPAEVGIYAAAARITEIWYFLPIALASSLLPVLVQRLHEDERSYLLGLEHAYRVAGWLAILLAVGVTIVATPLVSLVFGDEYARTAEILRLHTWSAPFVFLSAVLGRALVAEDHRRFELTRHGSGAVLNVALNLVLIPPFAGMGAAVATLLSYGVTAYAIPLAYPPTRRHARLIARAVAQPWKVGRALP